jgi:DNA-binding response OmpR family regulator
MQSKILVVDDEENIRRLYKAELAADGYEVLTADSGESAVEAIEDHAPHLVVLDIRMSGSDGLDVLGTIKARSRETPVVLNSAFSMYKNDFKSWLADAYVVKSSDLSELKLKIRELLHF